MMKVALMLGTISEGHADTRSGAGRLKPAFPFELPHLVSVLQQRPRLELLLVP
jgi:hypothetical protein